MYQMNKQFFFALFCALLFLPATSFASGDDGGGEGWYDCAGVMNGPHVTDNEGGCCLKEDKDCTGICNGDAVVGCDNVCDSGLVNDECNVCNGPGPGQCGCGQTVNSFGCCGNETNEGCGCGQTCPEDCYFVAAWANYSGHAGGYGGYGPAWANLTGSANKYNYTNPQAVPGCFHQQYASSCPLNTTTPHIVRYGNCVDNTGFLGSVTALDLGVFLGAPQSVLNQLQYVGYPNVGQVEMLMDENCNYVPWDNDKQLCGFAGVSWSPISLIWDDSAPLEQGMTVAKFSLAADRPNAFSLWKASDKAPLLVFDPYKTGKVSSSRQLFGNYAFGGVTKKVASFNNEKLGPTWTNGFEALALLDRDKNGRVSGVELDGVYLWFDADRDAEVDAGELRDIKEEGVISLFYKDVKNVSGSKDMIAQVGFERKVNGKIVRGAAVDWYSKVFSSRFEAVNALAAMFLDNDGTHADAVNKSINGIKEIHAGSWPHDPMRFTPREVKAHSEDLSGFWVWQLKESGGNEHPGVFAFDESSSEVVGYSVIESMLEKGQGKKSAVSVLPAKGSVAVNEQGERVFTFETFSPKSHGKATSVARLTNNGHTLIGSTTQTFESDRNGETVSATVNYEWFARKFVK